MNSHAHIFVSVVMSVYHGEAFLREAIESILRQTHTHFEFIIIDDASEDSSARILEDHRLKDDRFHFIRNTRNIGLTRSLNLGLKIAKGKYIARMDADDIALPERLSRQVAMLEHDHTLMLVGAGVQIIDERGHRIEAKTYPETDTDIRWKMLFDNAFCHSAVMFRHCAPGGAPEVYHEDLPCAQDYDLWIRLLKHGRGYNIQDPLLLYRSHHRAISHTAKSEQQRIAKTISVACCSALLDSEPHMSQHNLLQMRAWFLNTHHAEKRPVLKNWIDLFDAFKKRYPDDTMSLDRIQRVLWRRIVLDAPCHERMGQYAQLLDHYGTETLPLLNLYHYAGLLREAQRLEEARALYGFVIQRRGPADDMLHALAHYQIGRMSFDQGDREMAQHHFQETLKRMPDHHAARSLIHQKNARFSWRGGRVRQRPCLAVVTSLLDIGGVQSMIGTLCEFLRKDFDMHFIAHVNPDIQKRFQRLGLCSFLPDVKDVMEYLCQHHVDVVFAPNVSWLWEAFRINRIPCLEWSVHGREYPSGLGVCIRPAYAQQNSTAVYVPDPIDVKKIRAVKRVRLWTETDIVLGAAIRISPLKNIPLLVHGVRDLQQQGYSQAKLLLLGAMMRDQDGEGQTNWDDVRCLCESLLLPGSFQCLEEDDPIAYIKGMDVAVCTSLSEGLPIYLLEAAAARVPIVAADVGYIAHFLNPPKGGLVFARNDQTQMGIQIRRVLSDPTLRETMVSCAFDEVHRYHDVAHVGPQYRKLLLDKMAYDQHTAGLKECVR